MKAKVAQLPTLPGCYFFKDSEGVVLYVGKAKNLRSRVRSYFGKDVIGKTALMVAKAADIDIIVTRNEVEALLLENRLINQHKPQYNIALRENRRYAWICVTDEEFPRIITARNKQRKGTYYGPYTDGTARRNIIIALNKIFTLRTCTVLPKHVCLQYHIGNCSGPCAGHDTKEGYRTRVKRAQDVLEGRKSSVIKQLQEEMQLASQAQNFEQAKYLRDMITALSYLQEKQIVERSETRDQDVIGCVQHDEEMIFVCLHIHRGVIRKKQEFTVSLATDVQEEFLLAFYRQKMPPSEIITTGIASQEIAILEEYFTHVRGAKVTITQPERGTKKELLLLATQNAQIAATQQHLGLASLKKALRLSTPPQVIDCFDISTHQGTTTVGARVRYRAGKPDPSGYRHYIISAENSKDDFSAMKEVVSRSYRTEELPDLIVIDGGKGQLSFAQDALDTKRVPIIALAKKEEEIYVPGLSFSLRLNEKDPGLLLLRRIRDATHRFVIGHHRSRRGKEMHVSELDAISGIGEKRKHQLYTQFKTVSAIKKATAEQLQEVLGEKTGKNVYEQLHAHEKTKDSQ